MTPPQQRHAKQTYLVVIDSAFVGGMEIHTAQWVRPLAQAGCAVTVLQLGKDVLGKPLAGSGASVVHHPLDKTLGKAAEYKALGRILKQHQADVTVYCRNGFAVVVLLALWRHSKKLVTIDHAISGHIGFYDPHWQPPSRIKCMLSNFAIDHTLAVSEAVRQSAINIWRAKPAKVSVAYNWVDTQKHQPDAQARDAWRMEHGIRPEELVIGFLGRLGSDKRVVESAQGYVAFLEQHAGPTRLILVGSGPELGQVQQVIEAHPRAAATFTHINWSDQPENWHRAFDIELNLTRIEAFGLSVVEAMACGGIVLAQNNCGVDEYLIDGQNGFLADLPDASAVAARLQQIASLSPDQRQAISHAARQTAVERFSPSVSLANLLDQLGASQAASLVRQGQSG